MTTKIINFSFLLFFCGIAAAHAQSGTVATGGDASGTGGTAAYSIGQTDYISANGAGGTITQGIQQPYEIQIMTGVENTTINLSASVYPNPTADYVTLNVQEATTGVIYYTLCDMQGRVIRKEQLNSNITIIQMAELSKAAYLIKVWSNNKEIKVFKVIKN